MKVPCFLYIFFATTIFGSPILQPTLNMDYWAQRGQILEEEEETSLGGRLKFGYGERAANDILMEAKNEEISKGFEDPSSFLPAKSFLTAADDIRNSPTFKIIRDMPKGGALHVHDTSIASGEFIYNNITFRENLYVCLHGENGSSIRFQFLSSADSDNGCGSSSGWELLADIRANESIAEDVNNKIRNALTMIVPDPREAYPDGDAAWSAFNNIFVKLSPLLTYLPVYIDFYYQGLTELRQDNVFYLELRSTLPTLYDLDGNTYGPLDVARIYKNTTDRFVNDNPDFIGAKLIYAPIKTAVIENVDEYLHTAALLKRELPDFVAGFDLVGQEERGEPLIWYADRLRTISPDIKLFFHAGETKWNGLNTDQNLIDAVLLNTTRIGHGYAILKHPKILELVRRRKIAIEVNPISNQVLALVDDLRNHPASYLFAKDYPVVVSSDDPGLWGAVALSYDFYEAFVGIMSRSADIRAMKQLAINSIKYSAMTSEEKNRAYNMWSEKWYAFIVNLVQDKSVVSISKR